MTKTEKRRIGDVGEELACRFLKKRDFKVLERNYLKKWGEIDVIARRGPFLHFVEVKTVQGPVSREKEPDSINDISRETLMRGRDRVTHETSEYNPAENVHPGKLKRLHRAIESYLMDRKVPEETSWQLDVVTVRLDLETKKAKVELLENVIA